MERLVIQGGRPLKGVVRIGGAKNAALPLLAATLLTDEECLLRDVPRLRDIDVMTRILRALGVRVEERWEGGERILSVQAKQLVGTEVPEELMRLMRSSVVLLGPLLGRMGRATLSQPGGCAIGPRPINFHLQALRALGATVREGGGYLEAYSDGLRGATIHFDQPSVGATENAILGAVLARGETRIFNAAREPEVADLAAFLNAMGARVRGVGSDVIVVTGVEALHGADHRVIPDRIEAGTFLAAAAATGGEIELENVEPAHLVSVIAKLRETGATIDLDASRVVIRGPRRASPIDLKTAPYPAFPTDLQSIMMAYLTCAAGTSVITETVFENRFRVVGEFIRMGASIDVEGRVAVVRGVGRLTGTTVEAMDDLRGGAALVVAGLMAEGVTVVEGLHHIERGYEALDQKLRRLGATICRLPSTCDDLSLARR